LSPFFKAFENKSTIFTGSKHPRTKRLPFINQLLKQIDMASEPRLKIVDVLKSDEIGKIITVKGWVRTRRGNKQVGFIALNDGSTIHNLQIVVDVEQFGEEFLKKASTGAAIGVTGEITPSQGSGQKVELLAKQIEIIGECDVNEYPLAAQETLVGIFTRDCPSAFPHQHL
jgi:aspartyl/asparaginyl-tRNA synthetase